MSFLEPRVSFSSNFASHFSFVRHSTSVLFHLNLYVLWTKVTHESQISRRMTAHMKINQNPYVTFQATSQFFFNFYIILQSHDI